jgi:hypothetical protein
MGNAVEYISQIGNALKTVVLFIFIGIIIGAGSVLTYQHYQKKPVPQNQTSAITISGKPLNIKGTTTNNTNATIIVDYSGDGESQIIVPYTEIPPANKWIHYKYSVNAYYMSDQTVLLGLGYHFDQLTVAGGFFARVDRSPYLGWWVGGSWAFQL